MKRTLLLDGDIFAFTHAAAAEKPWDWGNDQWSLTADAKAAASSMDAHIHRLVDTLEADEAVVALSDPSGRYFRHSVLPSYKSNRKGKRKPLVLNVLKDHLRDNYRSFIKDNLEADDVLGILSTHPSIIPGERIIVSVDKDFKTIPGLFYHMNDQEVTEYSEAEADYWHMYQTLTGDSTDGYSGCPGIGPKRAAALFLIASGPPENFCVADVWPVVLAAFRKAQLSEAIAIQQARVARICRHQDYDFKKKEVILWTPT